MWHDWPQRPRRTNYSALPLQYASRLSAQFSWQKTRFILYCLNMSCRVIFRECMNVLCLTFGVSLLMFRWNVSNDRRSSSCICRVFVWISEQGGWSLMSRAVLCRASKPLKSVALLDSTNVLIGSRKRMIRCCTFSRLSWTFWTASSLTSYSRPSARLLGTFSCSPLQWFHVARLWSSGLPWVSSISRCDSLNQRV